MEIKEMHLVIVVFGVLFLLGFFYNNSMTGNLVKDAYCDDLGCYNFCEKTAECTKGELCCESDMGGVCKPAGSCQIPHYSTQANIVGSAITTTDVTKFVKSDSGRVYLILFGIVALIVVAFILFGRKGAPNMEKGSPQNKTMNKQQQYLLKMKQNKSMQKPPVEKH